MLARSSLGGCLTALLLVLPVFMFSQSTGQKHTLIINGQSTDVPLIHVNGHAYVGLEALAAALKGSLSSSGKMIALSIPVDSAKSVSAERATTSSPASTNVSAPMASSNPGFSREFLNAGIEQMSTLREWHTALQTAIQSGIPLSAGLLAPYRAQATTNLHLASVAANTTSDHSAYQLLSNEFQNMAKLSDKYISLRASLTYIAPDTLHDDELNKRIIACGHSLRAMAAAGQFSDDGACH
ncbi:MAG: hypothetical protein WAK48_14935 [Candidatus Acidiferrum sp.]|jgi:hypothetical protein